MSHLLSYKDGCMNNFLEKLGSYHIFTNIIPGAFFALALKYLFGVQLSTGGVEDILIYYFVGLLIGRIGSLIVVRVLRKKVTIRGKEYCFIRYAPYPDYLKAVKLDNKIDVLSETNDCFRNLLTASLLLIPFVHFYSQFIQPVPLYTSWRCIAILLLIALFAFAFREQANHIRRRVEIVLEQT